MEKFVSYDPFSKEILINGPEATREDIGIYDLRFYVTYSNSTLEWDEDFIFKLIVYADDIIDDPFVVECLKGEVDCPITDDLSWKGKVIEGDGTFDSDSPIPSITFVSPTGLVTITWDREIQIPVEELDKIALDKIGMRDFALHSDYGKGTGLAIEGDRRIETSST